MLCSWLFQSTFVRLYDSCIHRLSLTESWYVLIYKLGMENWSKHLLSQDLMESGGKSLWSEYSQRCLATELFLWLQLLDIYRQTQDKWYLQTSYFSNNSTQRAHFNTMHIVNHMQLMFTIWPYKQWRCIRHHQYLRFHMHFHKKKGMALAFKSRKVTYCERNTDDVVKSSTWEIGSEYIYMCTTFSEMFYHCVSRTRWPCMTGEALIFKQFIYI